MRTPNAPSNAFAAPQTMIKEDGDNNEEYCRGEQDGRELSGVVDGRRGTCSASGFSLMLTIVV